MILTLLRRGGKAPKLVKSPDRRPKWTITGELGADEAKQFIRSIFYRRAHPEKKNHIFNPYVPIVNILLKLKKSRKYNVIEIPGTFAFDAPVLHETTRERSKKPIAFSLFGLPLKTQSRPFGRDIARIHSIKIQKLKGETEDRFSFTLDVSTELNAEGLRTRLSELPNLGGILRNFKIAASAPLSGGLWER
jgi:hypothetical protein